MSDRRDGRWQSDRWRGNQREGREGDRDREVEKDRDRSRQQQQQRRAMDGERTGRPTQWSAAGSKRAADSRDEQQRQQYPMKQQRRDRPQQQERQVRLEDERWRPQEEGEEEGELRTHYHHSTHSQPVQQQRSQELQQQQQHHSDSRTLSDGDAHANDSAQSVDSDSEEVAIDLERREREDRKRRRADILTRHQSTATAQQPEETAAGRHSEGTSELSLLVDQPSTTQPQPPSSTPSVQPVVKAETTAPLDRDDVAASTSEYDMFADSPSLLLPRFQSFSKTAAGAETAVTGASELLDSWDDAEGYYKYRVGDVLTDSASRRQYRVCGLQGSGVFSTVLRVKLEGSVEGEDTEGTELVIKVIRNNETMYKAGVKEVEFLTRIASTSAQSASTASSTSASSPLPRRHIVQLLHHFHHRSHLCLVFTPYAMDLRKVIKKFGTPHERTLSTRSIPAAPSALSSLARSLFVVLSGSVGLSLPAVRVYAMQLLTALRHLVRAGVVHGDIKPDNILVNERLTECALCDFGSASYLADCSITPYLVSRFYRAPEIMLGCEYGFGIDTWSVGCVLYELYTGRILFDGRDNNDMLHKIKQLRGDYPVRLIRRATFAARHFDADGHFTVTRKDVNGALYRQSVPVGAQRELHADMRQFRGAEAKDEAGTRRLRRLTELILQCLTLDPLKRPSVDELIKHPFISEG